MTGWKDWQIGEVVTESDFQNLVQDQVVQRYADAATRTSTLGTAIAEGMVSYLEDTNKVEVYDGSSWVQVGQEGDITSVTAGTGLTGGGTAGDVTLSADYAAIGSAITVDQTQVTGLTTGTAGQLVVSAGTAGVTYEDAEATLVAGTQGYTALSNGTAGITYQPVSHNYIINGAFEINQRGFTSTTTSGLYLYDRWNGPYSGGTVTYSAETFTPGTAPIAGYEGKNYIRVATASQSASSEFTLLDTPLEGGRTLAGQTVTASFFAKASSGTPKIALEINQKFGSGGSPSADVDTYAGQVTTSTSWARYSITFTVPSVASKTFGTSNSDGVFNFRFWLSAGADFNARTGSIGLQNATIDLWGVQLEAGSVATPFKRHAPSLQGELAACQRYYYRARPGGAFTVYGLAVTTSTTSGQGMVQLPVTMRVTPTSIDFSNLGYIQTLNDTTYAISAASLNPVLASPSMGVIGFTVATVTALQNGRLATNNSVSGFIGFSAEL